MKRKERMEEWGEQKEWKNRHNVRMENIEEIKEQKRRENEK